MQGWAKWLGGAPQPSRSSASSPAQPYASPFAFCAMQAVCRVQIWQPHSTCRPAPCMHLHTCEHQGHGSHERHRDIADQRDAGQLVQRAHCIEKGKKEERCRPGARIKGAQRRVK